MPLNMPKTDLTFWDFAKAAFNARPGGMFFAPNWALLLGFFAGGFVNPGFWLAGIGAELALVLGLASNGRFQNVMRAKLLYEQGRNSQQRVDQMVARLSGADQQAYRNLADRCRSVLTQQLQQTPGDSGVDAQGEGLSRLLWIYLRLLIMRQTIRGILESAQKIDRESIPDKIARLQQQLKATTLSDELRRSLEGQVDILTQRQTKQAEAHQKIDFVEAELARIEEQVELIREQAAVTAGEGGGATVSERIDQIGSTLNSTNEWMSKQQDLYGSVADLIDAPPILLPTKN
jgi:hypothetical protein